MILPWIYTPSLFVLALLLGTVVLFVRAVRVEFGDANVPRWMPISIALFVWSANVTVLVLGVEPRSVYIMSVLMWSLMSVEALLLWAFAAPPPAPTATLPPTYPHDIDTAEPDDEAESRVQVIRARYKGTT